MTGLNMAALRYAREHGADDLIFPDEPRRARVAAPGRAAAADQKGYRQGLMSNPSSVPRTPCPGRPSFVGSIRSR